MIIVVAILVAHSVDRAFYTVKQSSLSADNTVKYFGLILKLCIMVMVSFIFIKLHRVIKAEPLLKLNKTIYRTHVAALVLYYSLWVAYDVTYNVWEDDPENE